MGRRGGVHFVLVSASITAAIIMPGRHRSLYSGVVITIDGGGPAESAEKGLPIPSGMSLVRASRSQWPD